MREALTVPHFSSNRYFIWFSLARIPMSSDLEASSRSGLAVAKDVAISTAFLMFDLAAVVSLALSL
jgi:hypothetical protein